MSQGTASDSLADASFVTRHLITWPAIARLGQSRLAKVFNVFFVATPILAYMFSRLPEQIEIRIFGAAVPIVTELPFRIVVFFLCSVCFAFGNALYVLFCPPLIKKYPDYSEFAKADGSFETIKHQIQSVSLGGGEKRRRALAVSIVDRFCVQTVRDTFSTHDVGIEEGLRNATANDGKLRDIFACVFAYAANSKPYLRAFCVSFYAAALVLLGTVLWENIRAVLRGIPAT